MHGFNDKIGSKNRKKITSDIASLLKADYSQAVLL